MKRITSICLVFFTVMALFMGTAFAEAKYDGDIDEDLAVILLDADSGDVLHKQNEDKQIRPASTTKILTCIVALEKGNLNDTVTVSRKAEGISGSELEIVRGEEIKLKDLLGGMMMVSGNDAATAVAEHIADSTDDFVDMMNAKAKEIGMENSHFANVHGKDTDNHYVTASDMAKLARYAYNNKTFMEIVSKSTYDMPGTNKRRERTVNSTNYLVRRDEKYPERYYKYATGMKTGSTPLAGDCLVASATKGSGEDEKNLICLIFGVKDSREYKYYRWEKSKELFEWGFDKFTTVDLSALLEDTEAIQKQVENYAANDPKDGLLEFSKPAPAEQSVTIGTDIVEGIQNKTDEIEISHTLPDTLQAPILQGEVLGTVTYRSKNTGEIIFSGNLIASRDVLETGTEPGASGNTAVATLPPTVPKEIVTRDDAGVFWWLIVPGGLIAFLVFRLTTVNRRKRKRFNKKRRPHYSYKIKR